MASGVSSMMRSTPVRVSMVRMLRPSRPIMRPFISSLGQGYHADGDLGHVIGGAALDGGGHDLRARWSASSLARASISLILRAVSWVTSDSTWAMR